MNQRPNSTVSYRRGWRWRESPLLGVFAQVLGKKETTTPSRVRLSAMPEEGEMNGGGKSVRMKGRKVQWSLTVCLFVVVKKKEYYFNFNVFCAHFGST